MRRRKRKEFDRKDHFLTFYYPRTVLPAPPDTPVTRIIMVRTKAEWSRLGKIPKPGEAPLRWPIFSVHKPADPTVRMEYFSADQMMDAPHLGDSERYSLPLNFAAWRHIIFPPRFGPVRNSLQRALDKYWFVPVPLDKYGLLDDDLDNIAPKRRIIYPAAIYRDSRESRAAHGREERVCEWCEKPFISLRRNAQFCPGGKCRKAANRWAKKHVTDVRTNINIEGGH